MNKYFASGRQKIIAIGLLFLQSQYCLAGVISSTAKAANKAAIAASVTAAGKATAAGAERAAEQSARQASTKVDFRKFTYHSITGGLKKGLKRNLHGTMQLGAGTNSAVNINLITKPGALRNRFGKEWIQVNTLAEIRVGSNTSRHKTIELYDKNSSNLIFVIYQDDDSITEYKPLQMPQYINLNETYKTDEVEVRSKDGTVISRGIVNFRMIMTNIGLESCWIENTKSIKDKPIESISTACETFDEKMQPISYKEELLENGIAIFSVTGKTEIK